MAKLRFFLLPLSVLLGLGILVAFVKASQSYLSEHLLENSKELIGQRADIQGLARLLQDERVGQGQDLQLIFWSVTCAPCLAELPQLGKVTGLIFPINTDPEEQRQSAEQTLQKLAPQFSFIQDKDKFLQSAFKVKYLPTQVKMNSAGVIQDIKVGLFKE